VLPDAEIAVDIDPHTLTAPMAETLGFCGINRASLGVQSFNSVVQRAINRLQSLNRLLYRSSDRARIRRLNSTCFMGYRYRP
jgi:oxygen-independent coproporphyrinogen-3 oxidase